MLTTTTKPTDILHYGRMPWPTDWTTVFGREAPLLLEIGFGGADYLIDWAKRRPDANVLGLEISLPALRKGTQKIRVAGLTNARVMQADSRGALQLLCQPNQLTEVVINFPDPWPKAGHQHRRLISDRFLHLLATRMPSGAPLDINTDHADYQLAISEFLARTPYFRSRLDVAFVTEDTERLRTKYEQFAIDDGRTCHYYKWERNDAPAPDVFPILEEKPMPHVVLASPMTLAEISAEFEPRLVQSDTMSVKFLDVYRSEQYGKLLFEVYVSEDPFHQRVCLELRQRVKGDFVVNLAEMGFPRPTPGLHFAAHQLVEWVQSLHPDVEILNSTLKLEEQ